MAKRAHEPSADDLLSGRTRPTAIALLRCIHHENPTPQRTRTVLGEATWSQARLDEIGERSRSWLSVV